MTAVVGVSVKPSGGGDFVSLDDLADNYLNKDLPSQDIQLLAEVYSGGNAILAGKANFNAAWTTDSTRYIEIRAAPGHQHAGVWNTGKAYALNTDDTTIVSRDQFIKIGKMQVRSVDGGGGGSFALDVRNNVAVNSLTTADRCIIINDSDGNPTIRLADQGDGSSRYAAKFTNCAIVNDSAGTGRQGLGVFGGFDVGVYNCSIIAIPAVDVNNAAFFMTISGISGLTPLLTSQNNYLAGNACYLDDAAGADFVKGANDATVNAEALAALLRNIPYSVANFINVGAGTENLHLLATSALVGKGADLTGIGIVEDFEGDPRMAPFDIGADQILLASGPSVLLLLGL